MCTRGVELTFKAEDFGLQGRRSAQVEIANMLLSEKREDSALMPPGFEDPVGVMLEL